MGKFTRKATIVKKEMVSTVGEKPPDYDVITIRMSVTCNIAYNNMGLSSEWSTRNPSVLGDITSSKDAQRKIKELIDLHRDAMAPAIEELFGDTESLAKNSNRSERAIKRG